MKQPLSAYSKALVAGVGAAAAAIAATFPNSAVGKWCVVVGALLAATGLTAVTKNTAVVHTGPGDGPATIGAVVDAAGTGIGTVIADTGTAAGGIVAGTTGVVGAVLDATVGKILPGGN